MALKLMYITNKPQIAQIAESAGVDRIFVDLEYIGKSARQDNMDTVQSHHTVDDVKIIADDITTAELLVRINPIHKATAEHTSSKEEIDAVIKNGANILMLPYFKTLQEAKEFLKMVDGRAKTMLLIETPEAVEIIDDVLKLDGIDYIHIGLNDLSLGYGKKFMFELLIDGTVETICKKISKTDIIYGFGGVASLGRGMLPAEMVIREHYRLGSQCAILSRSFCNVDKVDSIEEIEKIFSVGLKEIRNFEAICQECLENQNEKYFRNNQIEIEKSINKIVEGMKV